MPDHLYIPAAPVTWRDHIAAHPGAVTLAGIIGAAGVAVVADGMASHTVLPALYRVPSWVQIILGSALVLGVVLALAGMVWRPAVVERDGKLLARVDDPIAIERLGWIITALATTAMAIAVGRTGPWVLATLLPASWATQAASRALWLTWFARKRRKSLERIDQMRIVR